VDRYLSNRAGLVTAASQGSRLPTARIVTREGADVVIAKRDPARIDGSGSVAAIQNDLQHNSRRTAMPTAVTFDSYCTEVER
jgi:NAD(P)-dependent dehydrogenase (short-subunit alcohol dehydrogenase family)